MGSPRLLLIGAECEGECDFTRSVRKTGAELLIARTAEQAAELLSSHQIDGVLIHQDRVGFGNMIAADLQERWPDKPQQLVCQQCARKPLVPFDPNRLAVLEPPQVSGNFLLYSESSPDSERAEEAAPAFMR